MADRDPRAAIRFTLIKDILSKLYNTNWNLVKIKLRPGHCKTINKWGQGGLSSTFPWIFVHAGNKSQFNVWSWIKNYLFVIATNLEMVWEAISVSRVSSIDPPSSLSSVILISGWFLGTISSEMSASPFLSDSESYKMIKIQKTKMF